MTKTALSTVTQTSVSTVTRKRHIPVSHPEVDQNISPKSSVSITSTVTTNKVAKATNNFSTKPLVRSASLERPTSRGSKSSTSEMTMNLCTLPRGKSCISKYFIFVEARSVHRKEADGSLVRDESVPCPVKVKVPRKILEIDKEVVKSGMAIYPGELSETDITFK